MDASRFDALSKAIGTGTTRRRMLVGLLAGALAGFRSAEDGAADKKGKNQRSKRRLRTNAKACGKKGDSCTPNTCCKNLECLNGSCDVPPKPGGNCPSGQTKCH